MFHLAQECGLRRHRLWTPLFFIGDYSKYHGLSNDLAFYMLSIMNGMSVIGRLVVFIGDRVGR